MNKRLVAVAAGISVAVGGVELADYSSNAPGPRIYDSIDEDAGYRSSAPSAGYPSETHHSMRVNLTPEAAKIGRLILKDLKHADIKHLESGYRVRFTRQHAVPQHPNSQIDVVEAVMSKKHHKLDPSTVVYASYSTRTCLDGKICNDLSPAATSEIGRFGSEWYANDSALDIEGADPEDAKAIAEDIYQSLSDIVVSH